MIPTIFLKQFKDSRCKMKELKVESAGTTYAIANISNVEIRHFCTED